MNISTARRASNLMEEMPRIRRTAETIKRLSGGDPLASAVMELNDTIAIDMQELVELTKQLADDMRSIANDISTIADVALEKDLAKT